MFNIHRRRKVFISGGGGILVKRAEGTSRAVGTLCWGGSGACSPENFEFSVCFPAIWWHLGRIF